MSFRNSIEGKSLLLEMYRMDYNSNWRKGLYLMVEVVM